MKQIVWTEPAEADVRRLDRPIAMQVFYALDRFAKSGEGDVKTLEGRDECRLRIGDYRLLFISTASSIEVRHVRHRSEAYR
jgi:mRNA interferase RelE/StbE